jgi:ABC-type bacteriocin/lantibiotic exporter with double-glycine peptidase domain
MDASKLSYEVVRQKGLFDCGAACLTALLRYHGLSIYSKQLNLYSKGFGVTLYELLQGAQRFGFKGSVYQASDLKSLLFPCIVPMRFLGFRHYWLVYESRGETLLVMDPALGKIAVVRKKMFVALWSGIFMIVRQEEAHA